MSAVASSSASASASSGSASPSSTATSSASSSASQSSTSSSSSSSSSSSASAPSSALTPSIIDDSKMDRMIKDVVCPPAYALTKEKLFDKKGLPNLAVLKEHLLREGRLALDAAMQLVQTTSAMFKAEPNLLELKYPITVCGDVHGQYFDLMRLFEVGGDPKDTQFLFLGDYVDRGCFSTEVVFYLYACKILFPKSFWMLRGNHECRQLTSFFNFKDECVYKYNLELYDEIMGSFDNLPLAAIVNKAFFCVHGGLSPDITSLEEIKVMDRFQEIPREGPMCDLLWSDPYEEDAGGTPNPDSNPDGTTAPKHQQEATQWFGYNETRQCSYVYGIEAVKQFLKDNKLTALIRAHEAQLDGYKMQMINKASGIPRVITIFSAPNYCDVYKNKAACLKFDNNVLNIKQFIDSPHPYYLPNFMDVFQWSLPFVAEKVTDMLINILDSERAAEGSDEEGEDSKTVVEKRGGLLKKKVTAVTKLIRMYRILRQEHEAILQLKQLTPSHKVPFGLLAKGSEAIKEALSTFDTARRADKENERRPDAPLSPTAGQRTFKNMQLPPSPIASSTSASTAEDVSPPYEEHPSISFSASSPPAKSQTPPATAAKK